MTSVAKPMATVGTSTSERRPSTKAAPAIAPVAAAVTPSTNAFTRGSFTERREAKHRARSQMSTHHPDRECRNSTQQEHPDEFRFRRGRDKSAHGKEHPEQPISRERHPNQLVGAPGDDRDDSGADAVERALH